MRQLSQGLQYPTHYQYHVLIDGIGRLQIFLVKERN